MALTGDPKPRDTLCLFQWWCMYGTSILEFWTGPKVSFQS